VYVQSFKPRYGISCLQVAATWCHVGAQQPPQGIDSVSLHRLGLTMLGFAARKAKSVVLHPRPSDQEGL
jgi:hypothetical protein